MRVAVLGTGIMGTGMAHSLLRSGLDVTVWNRTRGRAEPLAAAGADVAGSPSEAVADADAVITILWDGNSVADVMADALPAASDGVLWVQASTVSVHDAGDMLAALADGCGARVLRRRAGAGAGVRIRARTAALPARAPRSQKGRRRAR